MGTPRLLKIAIFIALLIATGILLRHLVYGRVIWSKKYTHRIEATATDGQVFYVLSGRGTFGNGEIIECFDIDGKPQWKHDLTALLKVFTASFDNMLVSDGKLYVAGGGESRILQVDQSGIVAQAQVPDGIWKMLDTGSGEIYAVTPYKNSPGMWSGAIAFDSNLKELRRLPFDGQFMAMDAGDDGSLAYIELVLGANMSQTYDDHQQLKYMDRDGNVIFVYPGDFNGFGNKVFVEREYVAAIGSDGLHILDKQGRLLFKSAESTDDLASGRTESEVFCAANRDQLGCIIGWDSSGNKLWEKSTESDYFSWMGTFGNYLLCSEVDIEGHTLQSWMALPDEVKKADNIAKPGAKGDIKRIYHLVCRDQNGNVLWQANQAGKVYGSNNLAIGPDRVLLTELGEITGEKARLNLVRLD
ncbi:MAG: PQQ-like beta-propeller repeat protein [Planctomycetales bacterium]|nr:PQQ-like beta-propeller repeat protein [bacterium]UNM07696.1 MAG: PQQ-like beta-propeller repeat protein [Planctomycetales bacterium]